MVFSPRLYNKMIEEQSDDIESLFLKSCNTLDRIHAWQLEAKE